MATVVTKTRVCDVCREEAQHYYRITDTHAAETWNLDLCIIHAQPVRELTANVPAGKAKGRRPVVTQAEVTAARKKTTRKRATVKK